MADLHPIKLISAYLIVVNNIMYYSPYAETALDAMNEIVAIYHPDADKLTKKWLLSTATWRKV